uniref:Polysaccharide deacetylase n=1 Tax=Bursaphelenchus xylophilus TaxID=6326 RepID=A0A1I7RLU4_BURXY
MAEIGKGGHIQSLHQVSAENIQGLCQALEKGVVLYVLWLHGTTNLARWEKRLTQTSRRPEIGLHLHLNRFSAENYAQSP